MCRRSIEYLGRSARGFLMLRLSIQVPCLDASLLIRALIPLMIMLMRYVLILRFPLTYDIRSVYVDLLCI